MRKLLILGLTILASSLFAGGRKVVLPGEFYRVDITNYNLKSGRSGVYIELMVSLTSFNTSRTINGTLTLLPESNVVGHHGTIPATVAMYVATNLGCVATTPTSSGNQSLSSPLSQMFSLAPNQMATFAVGGVIHVTRNDGSGNHFYPSISIELNGNDGAVVGSVNPHILYAGSGRGTCIPNFSLYEGSRWGSMNNDFLLNTTPIPILGGRPF